ncbi:MAG: exodeoxyribonuclease VII large subunit, partial [Planctomycetota bacterium]
QIRLDAVARRFERVDPTARLKLQRQRLDALAKALGRGIVASRRDATASVARLADQLRALDPTAVLGRGYSITTTKSGVVVRSPDDVQPGDILVTRLRDGTLQSTVGTAKQMELFESDDNAAS